MRSIVKGVPTFMYGEELSRQLALDYCCSPADVADSKNHFSIYAPQEGRRRFQEALIRGLKIAVVNGNYYLPVPKKLLQNVESVMPM